MIGVSEAERGRDLVARWRILAQRRLDHLVELYQSGRWKLYHDESEFLVMVQDARAALAAWEALAPPDPAKDKIAEVAAVQMADRLPGNSSADGVAAQHDLRKS
ncbi:MAG: TIGR03809 family protein [Afipia sp.]|nr:TIGR03809 family protein [Afipia sp.]